MTGNISAAELCVSWPFSTLPRVSHGAAHRFVLLAALCVPAGAKAPTAFLGRQQRCREDRSASGALAQGSQESSAREASRCVLRSPRPAALGRKLK